MIQRLSLPLGPQPSRVVKSIMGSGVDMAMAIRMLKKQFPIP
jgi:hypothetical protein